MQHFGPYVALRREGRIAVVTVNNPPVNATRQEVRAGLMAAFIGLRSDPEIDSAVLICAGRTFIAGADINEFNKPPMSPSNAELIAVIEALEKPVVAAVHGTALGAGLEIAMGCHSRIATPTARFGLPEIKLGLIPGSGGTQRLPRLAGMEKALQMILTGETVSAKDAQESGLIDAVTAGDLASAAIEFAEDLARRGKLAVARDRDGKITPFRADPATFDTLAARFQKRVQGLDAAAAAIAALRSCLSMPIDEALVQERESFHRLRQGPQSKALRHVFFAEREASKVLDMPAGLKPREISRAAVIGAGTMGVGIAMCFANAGIEVVMIDVKPEALARGLEAIARNYKASVSRGGLAADEAERRLKRIEGASDLAVIADADIVVEAVFEDMAVKKIVFAEIDRHAKVGAVLATNTSYLNPNAIAESIPRPEAVVGMHFFSPANVMRLIEVVRGEKTSYEALATAVAIAKKLGKVPVVTGVCYGFVGNRMLRPRSVEAERLLLEGAMPHEIDATLLEFGFPMGPFAMADLAGLDISWGMRKSQGLRAEIADALCVAGQYGQKTGKGFYLYNPGSRAGVRNPEVEQMIVETSRRLGIERRIIGKQEITERLVFPIINEGARVLAEGIVQSAGDIDVVWAYGYGWPAWRGGPMHYADQTGLAHICERLTQFSAVTGDPHLRPAPLLQELAGSGKTFQQVGRPTS
jgi:3-hydroxyacyl-CoA dehydrogenase